MWRNLRNEKKKIDNNNKAKHQQKNSNMDFLSAADGTKLCNKN